MERALSEKASFAACAGRVPARVGRIATRAGSNPPRGRGNPTCGRMIPLFAKSGTPERERERRSAGGNVHGRAHYARWAGKRAMGRMAYARATATADSFARGAAGTVAVELALVPPNADIGARFQVQFVEDMLDVLLHRARAARQNLPD